MKTKGKIWLFYYFCTFFEKHLAKKRVILYTIEVFVRKNEFFTLIKFKFKEEP